jgi:hypothetical protein
MLLPRAGLQRLIHRGEGALELVIAGLEVRRHANPGTGPEINQNVAR